MRRESGNSAAAAARRDAGMPMCKAESDKAVGPAWQAIAGNAVLSCNLTHVDPSVLLACLDLSSVIVSPDEGYINRSKTDPDQVGLLFMQSL